jgi:hypothetical protein
MWGISRICQLKDEHTLTSTTLCAETAMVSDLQWARSETTFSNPAGRAIWSTLRPAPRYRASLPPLNSPSAKIAAPACSNSVTRFFSRLTGKPPAGCIGSLGVLDGEFVSEHLSLVLQDFFGSDEVTADVMYPPIFGMTRHWHSVSKISNETNNARVWGGIHTRHART